MYEMSCHFSKCDLFICFLRANCNRFLFSPFFVLFTTKVQIFWEGHKKAFTYNLTLLFLTNDKKERNFCDLPRISELYYNPVHSGSLIFYGLVRSSPHGALGSVVGFLASFLTSLTIWVSRTDDDCKVLKWIHQGMNFFRSGRIIFYSVTPLAGGQGGL